MTAIASRRGAAPGANLPVRRVGTAVAFNCSGRSGGTSGPGSMHSSWGGARNRADRQSQYLTGRQAETIIAAGRHAMALGCAFNRHVTIHWERAGIPDCTAAKATGDVIKLASDWARRPGQRLLWAWVRENDAGDGSKGSHVHILLYCHPSMPIGRMWRRWIGRVSGRSYRAGTVKSRTIGPSLLAAQTNPDVYAVNLQAVTAYVCKGTDPVSASALGLIKLLPGGKVIGKRSAVCQALGLD